MPDDEAATPVPEARESAPPPPKPAFALPTPRRAAPVTVVPPLTGPVAVADRFLSQARAALLDGQPIAASPEDVLAIARSWPARKHVLANVRTNDQELITEIIEFLTETAKRLDRSAKGIDRHATLVERAGLPVAVSLTVGGLGLLFSVGSALGPISMLTGGLVALVFCGGGRHILVSEADGRRDAVTDVRDFVAELKAAREKN